MKKKHGLIVVLCSLPFLSSCSDTCGNEQVTESWSPDRAHKFVVFVRNCGATTGLSTQASVLPAYQPLLNEAGNLLVMDGTVDVEGAWQSATQLSVKGVNSALATKQESAIGGISVSYGE